MKVLIIGSLKSINETFTHKLHVNFIIDYKQMTNNTFNWDTLMKDPRISFEFSGAVWVCVCVCVCVHVCVVCVCVCGLLVCGGVDPIEQPYICGGLSFFIPSV